VATAIKDEHETQPRRTARQAQTRQALIDAALDLVAAHGYDAITTDDIAEAANVSPRTFFRYFPTKESVLLFGEDDFVKSFSGVYLAQPAEVSEYAAVAASFVLLIPGVVRLHGRIRLYHKALASSHILRGQEQLQFDKNVADVATAIARRRGKSRTDAGSSLLAAVSMTILNTTLVEWAAGSPRVDPAELLNQRFAQLAALTSRQG
jgi:AcrR family transcriptional regulator